jgi:UDP-N-acetylglucosamine 2-epimerase
MSSDFYEKYLQDEIRHQNYVIKFLEAKIHRLEDENNKLNDSLEAVMVRDEAISLNQTKANYLKEMRVWIIEPLEKYKQALEIIVSTPLEYKDLKKIARQALEGRK